MIRNKRKEDRADNKAQKEREKVERKRKRAEDKAAKISEKANAARLRKMIAKNNCDYFHNHGLQTMD